MRYLLLLLVCFSILTISCVDNNKSHKTNKEVFESGQHSKSFLEIDEYIPEDYAEVIIDSTLSNGYKVNAIFSSDMENSIQLTEKIDSLTKITHFREFNIDLKVFKNQDVLFDDTIDKAFLIQKGIFTEEESQRYAINDFNFLNFVDACEGCPTLSLHYTNITSNKMKIVRFYFHEDKSFFEIIT